MAATENQQLVNNLNDFKRNVIEQGSNRDWAKKPLKVGELLLEIAILLIKCLWFTIKSVYKRLTPFPLKPIRGEIVLITGAGGGIGRQLSLEYGSEGATVVCWDINQKENSETVRQIEKLGRCKAYAYVCDISNRQQVLDVAAKVKREVGDVTILINNAGIMPCHPFLDHTAEEIQQIMNINTLSHFWTLQAFLPDMKKNNYGHIIAISSVAGLIGTKNLVPYCASKYAVRGMMEGLFQDLRSDPKCQIKLTIVYPFAVKTNLFDSDNTKTRFPSLFPVMDVKYVAKCIINAQRRNIMEISIPKTLYNMFLYGKMLPLKVGLELQDFVGVYIDTDLK